MRCLLMAALLMAAGCVGVPKRSGIQQSIEAQAQATALELRIRVRALADDIGGRIESSADRIRETSADPEVRRNALLWKMGSIPNFQATTYSPDPAGALADTWVLAAQMRNLFASDAGNSLFGESRPEALSTAQEVEGVCVKLVREITSSEDFTRAQGRVESWAAEHPITDLTFRRKSIYTELKTGSLEAGMDGLSPMEAVATLPQQLEDIEGYLTLFNKYLPNRIRWQVDLFSEEVLRDADSAAAIGSLVQLGETAREISPVIQEVPALVTTERTAIFDAVAEERRQALKEIDDLIGRREQFVSSTREDLESFVIAQRLAMIQDFARERKATLDEINRLTTEALASLRAERSALTADLEASGSQLLEESADRGARLIDRAFLWLALILGATLLLGFSGGWLLIRKAGARNN